MVEVVEVEKVSEVKSKVFFLNKEVSMLVSCGVKLNLSSVLVTSSGTCLFSQKLKLRRGCGGAP